MYYLPKFYPAVHKKPLGKRLNKVHTPYIIRHILPQFYFLVLFNGLEVLSTKITKRHHAPREKSFVQKYLQLFNKIRQILTFERNIYPFSIQI